MISSSTKDDTKDVVVVRYGIFDSFDNDRHDTVRTAITVSSRVPRFAGVVTFGEEMAIAKTSKTVWIGEHIETTSDGSINITAP